MNYKIIILSLALVILITCTRHENSFSTNTITNPIDTSSISFSDMTDLNEKIDEILGKYVTADKGLVNYAAIWEDSLLDTIIKRIENFDLSTVITKEDSFAFFINAYNLMVIYHTKSYNPDYKNSIYTKQGDFSFALFSKPIIIAKIATTLDKLEKDPTSNFIKQYNDPRTHFVLCCAALSCPPLANRAYRANTLYEEMDYKTKFFIADSTFNTIDKNYLEFSALFSWYNADFIGQVRDTSANKISVTGSGDYKSFISSYLIDAEKRSYLDQTSNFKSYNWEINRQ